MKCKRCLLLEAGEKVTYNQLIEYISTIDENELTDNNTFERRIKLCLSCDNLLSGMCVKCGCYVEVRARLKNAECADYDNKKW